jgi:flagellar assembly factor FliW
MHLLNTRFGTVEYTEEDIITFRDGMIGFPQFRNYVILSHKPESPFRWLQSVEEPPLAFLVVDPSHFVPDYAVELSDHQAAELELQESTGRLVFTTVSIPGGDPKNMTLNLAGPVVINADSRQAKQLVLDEGAYTIKHRVIPAADRASDRQAA